MATSRRIKEENYIEVREKDFEQTVKKIAKLNGWLYYHTYRSTRSEPGFPDCVMVRDNRVIFAELKREKGKLSEPQKEWLQAISKTPAETYIWRPSDIDEICKVLAR